MSKSLNDLQAEKKHSVQCVSTGLGSAWGLQDGKVFQINWHPHSAQNPDSPSI